MMMMMIVPFDSRWSLRFTESGWILHSQQPATGGAPPVAQLVSPLSLAHVLWTGADDLLDLSDHNDARQHVLHLLTRKGLR